MRNTVIGYISSTVRDIEQSFRGGPPIRAQNVG